MKYIPHIIGLLGVLSFVISYQQKSRKGIIAFSIVARICFIIQYVLLSAFEGAAQNAIGCVCALMAENKNKDIFSKRVWLWVGLVWVLTITAGVASWTSIFSLLPVLGMLLQNTALWINKPKTIRILTFMGLPFWITYNLHSMAYTAIISDVMCAVSLLTALYRYDFKKKKTVD